MTHAKLTSRTRCAHKPGMDGARNWRGWVMLLGAIPAAGCINLQAPTEPIVIELNINITQEVIYRLAEDAGNTIEENADIF